MKSLQEIDGYFLPNEDRSHEDSDEEEFSDDDEMIDFSDPNIFSGDSSHVQGNSLKRKHCK